MQKKKKMAQHCWFTKTNFNGKICSNCYKSFLQISKSEGHLIFEYNKGAPKLLSKTNNSCINQKEIKSSNKEPRTEEAIDSQFNANTMLGNNDQNLIGIPNIPEIQSTPNLFNSELKTIEESYLKDYIEQIEGLKRDIHCLEQLRKEDKEGIQVLLNNLSSKQKSVTFLHEKINNLVIEKNTLKTTVGTLKEDFLKLKTVFEEFKLLLKKKNDLEIKKLEKSKEDSINTFTNEVRNKAKAYDDLFEKYDHLLKRWIKIHRFNFESMTDQTSKVYEIKRDDINFVVILDTNILYADFIETQISDKNNHFIDDLVFADIIVLVPDAIIQELEDHKNWSPYWSKRVKLYLDKHPKANKLDVENHFKGLMQRNNRAISRLHYHISRKNKYVRLQTPNESAEFFFNYFEGHRMNNDICILNCYLYFAIKCPTVPIWLLSEDKSLFLKCVSRGIHILSSMNTLLLILKDFYLKHYERSRQKNFDAFGFFNKKNKFKVLGQVNGEFV